MEERARNGGEDGVSLSAKGRSLHVRLSLVTLVTTLVTVATFVAFVRSDIVSLKAGNTAQETRLKSLEDSYGDISKELAALRLDSLRSREDLVYLRNKMDGLTRTVGQLK